MNRATCLAVAMTTLLVALPLASRTAETYKVSTEARNDAPLIASPMLVVKEGVPADMKAEQGSQFSVTVTQVNARTVTVAADFESTQRSLAPVIVARLGRRAKVAVGNMWLALKVEPFKQ